MLIDVGNKMKFIIQMAYFNESASEERRGVVHLRKFAFKMTGSPAT